MGYALKIPENTVLYRKHASQDASHTITLVKTSHMTVSLPMWSTHAVSAMSSTDNGCVPCQSRGANWISAEMITALHPISG